MENELQCTYQEYYAMAGEFFKATKDSTDLESVENGHKCLALAYLNLTGQTENEQYQAEIILNLAGKRLLDVQFTTFKS